MYRILNMSSATATAGIDDRTTRARIRDAAISCFAEYGVAETTARKVATAAGVSPGSVIHHFGSMEGLRSACDEYVAAAIREYKQEALSGGPTLDVLSSLRNTEVGPLMGYLAQVLVDDSEAVAKLVDDLAADAEGYLRQGVEAGMLQSTADPRGRAVVLTIWNLGALVLHDHLQRMLGVDLTDPEILADPSFAAYAGPVYEIYGEGVLTDAFAAQARGAIAGIADRDQPTERTPADEATSPRTDKGTS